MRGTGSSKIHSLKHFNREKSEIYNFNQSKMSQKLPAINNSYANEDKQQSSLFDIPPPVAEEPERFSDAIDASDKFSFAFNKLSTLPFPILNNNTSVKNRINTLENFGETQMEFDRLSVQNLSCLANDLNTADESLRSIIGNVVESFDAKLSTLRKEYDHRFELQSNENKRLQNHVSSLKSDTALLKKKLVSILQFYFSFLLLNIEIDY